MRLSDMNVPGWLQLIGGLIAGVLFIGGLYATNENTNQNQNNRLTTIEEYIKDNRYLADRVLVLEQWKEREEKRSERNSEIQQKLADAIQSLSVSVARLDERLTSVREENKKE